MCRSSSYVTVIRDKELQTPDTLPILLQILIQGSICRYGSSQISEVTDVFNTSIVYIGVKHAVYRHWMW